MRYLDTGSSDPNQTLGSWFEAEVKSGLSAIRVQSGYFDADGLGFLLPVLAATQFDGVIGSNNRATLGSDVQRLVHALGLPRANVRLGIVSFGGALFHPKVYHLTRTDKSTTAYIGSANLSERGVSGTHVEAGVILDSRLGDDAATLAAIASAIEAWFVGPPASVTVVSDGAHVDALVQSGLLAAAPLSSPAIVAGVGVSSTGDANVAAPTRRRLIVVPPVPPWPVPVPVPYGTETSSVHPAPASGVASGSATFVAALPSGAVGGPAAIPTTTRSPFPNHVLFDPGSPTAPTSGLGALTQVSLPDGAVGLIIKLSKDSARSFAGGKGTTNITIPIETLLTVRFGQKRFKKYTRPRAEFNLELRFIGTNGTLCPPAVKTNIMPYGFLPGEKGHPDIRMLIPAAVKQLAVDIQSKRAITPQDGDMALLEWATPAIPRFRLTFVERSTPLAANLKEQFAAAVANGRLVGVGACWLPSGVSPQWPAWSATTLVRR